MQSGNQIRRIIIFTSLRVWVLVNHVWFLFCFMFVLFVRLIFMIFDFWFLVLRLFFFFTIINHPSALLLLLLWLLLVWSWITPTHYFWISKGTNVRCCDVCKLIIQLVFQKYVLWVRGRLNPFRSALTWPAKYESSWPVPFWKWGFKIFA